MGVLALGRDLMEGRMKIDKEGNDQGQIPFGQRLYDQPFVLLVIGLVVMFGFYTIWGWFEIVNLPQSTLP